MTEQTTRTIGSGTGQEVLPSLIWLGTSMWVAHASLTTGTAEASGALAAAIEALPSLVAAVLLSAASIAHAAASRQSRTLARLAVGLGAGLAFGLVAAAGMRLGYGPDVTTLAVVVGAAAVLGGAAAVLPPDALEAGLWATTWVLFAGVILEVLELPLAASFEARGYEVNNDLRLGIAQAVLTGVVGGYFARQWLRPWNRSRAIAAGALPGLVLLAADGLTRLATLVAADANLATPPLAAGQLDPFRHGLLVLVVAAAMAARSARA